MNRIIKNILTFCLLMTTSASFATAVSHNIPTKVANGSITRSPDNKVGTADDGITYTCSGSAVFSLVGSTSNACINMSKKNDCIIISPPLAKLSELKITPDTRTGDDVNIKVAISTDGETWTTSSVTMDYSNGTYITATIPVRAYYIKIYTTKAYNVDIINLLYTYLDCNCFTVTP